VNASAQGIPQGKDGAIRTLSRRFPRLYCSFFTKQFVNSLLMAARSRLPFVSLARLCIYGLIAACAHPPVFQIDPCEGIFLLYPTSRIWAEPLRFNRLSLGVRWRIRERGMLFILLGPRHAIAGSPASVKTAKTDAAISCFPTLFPCPNLNF